MYGRRSIPRSASAASATARTNFFADRRSAIRRRGIPASTATPTAHSSARRRGSGSTATMPRANRLARTLLRLGQEHGLRERGVVRIDLSLSQTELANLAGGTRESVNRHLHSLERLGVIALRGSAIVIRDAEALEQLG